MRSTRDFFIGIATGLTIGLLAAPRSGRESRQWLKEEYDKRTESSSGPGLKEQLTAIYEQVKQQIGKYIEQEKHHKQRLSDRGGFDYQRSRKERLSKPPY